MPIVVLGLSHKTAPLEIRDRHTVPANRLASALRALSEYSAIREAVILSTCNRLEMYADVEAYELGVLQLKEFLTAYRDMRVEDFDKYLYTMLGAEAVEQLYRVASGLDSMLVGEPQIVNQIKEAMRIAQEAGAVGTHLGRLFRMALQTGKRARSETHIGDDVVSLGAAAVELAQRHIDLSSTQCLVVGAGTMGTTAARHLHARGARCIRIVNRTLSKAESLAREVGGSAAGLDVLPDMLARSDLVITAVGSGRFLIDRRIMAHAIRSRTRGLLAIDIGVPRDIDPACASEPGAVLYSLEDLRDVVDESLQARRGEIPKVEAIVASQVTAFLDWYRSRGVVPLISELRNQAEAIRYVEIQRLFSSMPELDDRQRSMVIAASMSIINQLLHAPLTKLRETAAGQGTDVASQLAESLLDLNALSDRLQRQLHAHAAPLSRSGHHD